MGLSCYEHDAEAIRDFLMATNEDYDIKDALIALTSIVAGLQNPPKSEGDSQNVNQQLKDSISLQNEAAQMINDGSVLSDNQAEILQCLSDSVAKLESI